MKRTLTLTLLMLMLISSLIFTSCSSTATTTAATSTVATTTKAVATTTAPSGDTIKIGLVSPLTGSSAFGANEIKNAMELAIAKHPTVLGRKVEMIAADAQDASQAMSEFERLSKLGVKYYIGGYGTFADLAIQKVVDERNVIYMSSSGWANELTQNKIKNYFHFTPRVEVFGQRMAEYMPQYAEKYLGKKISDLKVGVIWNTNVEYVATAALKYLEKAGAKIVVKEGYPIDRKDFTVLISKLQSEKIDVLIPAQSSADGIPFRKKMVELGYDPPLTFAMGLIYDQPDFGKLGADIVDGAMVLSYTNPSMKFSAVPGLEEFKNNYFKKNGWYPLTHATQGYAGTLFLLDMIEKAGKDDVNAVQQALSSADIPAGKYPNYWGVKFDEYHRNTSAGDPLVIGQWQNGQLVSVGPDVIKTAEPIIPWDKSKLKK